MPQHKPHAGIDVVVKVHKEIVITLSQDRADCIAHQLDEVIGGEIDDNEYPDLHDFVEELNAVTKV